ncbi:glycosyltransferase family 4 protein [uncultured Prevotella sp.]|uniref:glycosyltransferase family 4 protein n=1 Tax=uncultured Prevotella sp. TaxID=159272 RepID=UPI0025D58BD0|nr:glycosyltransferase family 4 protein [uncultured Prevotella sp.]
MKIAILTSGIMPVPAVQGGAVETLIDFYLSYNDHHRLHDITVFSVWNPDVEQHQALRSTVNHYVYIKTNGCLAILKKRVFQLTHVQEYYHHSMAYYLHEAIKQIHIKNYDLIIIENRPGYVLTLNKQLINPTCILHLHNDFLNIETQNAPTIFQGYGRIICISNFITAKVNQIAPKHAKAITVHNAIDTKLFYGAKSAKREAIGFSEDDFVLVYSGRLNEEKGILPLVKAVKQLAKSKIKLLIIGDSNYGMDKHPTPFVDRLHQEVEFIKDQIVFTGFIDYSQIPSYLKMADIAVIPSMWDEPFGLTVVEAMAAGLPLITTRSGGIPEICEGVATIVDRDNIVENLANAILELYENPEKREAMAIISLKHSKFFDKERYAEEFYRALETM